MSIFEELGGIALDALGEVGALGEVTYASVVLGGYNPASGAAPPTTTVYDHVPAVIEEFKGLEALADGVQVGDKKVSIFTDSLPVEPSLQDRVTVSGLAYGIEAIGKVEAGGVVIQYVLHCRRG